MNKPSNFGDAEAKRILERAAEIDADRPVDTEALRQIALEAGISPASLEKALEEHLTPPLVAPPRLTLMQRLWRHRILLLGALLLVFYLLMRTVEMATP